MSAETGDVDFADDWTPTFEDLKSLVDYYWDRPVEFFDDLGFTLADTQVEILEAAQEHNRILVWSGNGTGKTAGVMMAQYWYLITRWNALGLVTSGNYDVMKDTSWPFLQVIHKRAQQVFPKIPGTIKQSPPSIDMEDWPEWFLRFRSPTYPQNLEGRHGRFAFVVIDESDKPDVGADHFSAATSTASNDDDLVIAIANPPEDRSNVAFDKWDSDRWHTIEFSSFDSHNVKRELGELPAGDGRGEIPGLVDLDLIIEDYEAWNGYDWPGVDAARSAVAVEDGKRIARDDHDRNLDPRWYRKRLGVMPPRGQGTLRPFYERHVDDAVERYVRLTEHRPESALRTGPALQRGADIARGGGDLTVVVDRYESGFLDVIADQQTADHSTETAPLLKETDARRERRGSFVIDAVGEGSGPADEVARTQTMVERFDGGENAADEDEYYNKAAEAYAALGDHLKNGAIIPPNGKLENQLREAARVMTLEEKPLKGGTTFRVKGKEDLKDQRHLGRSPDYLDAAALACYDGFDSEFVAPNVRGAVG